MTAMRVACNGSTRSACESGKLSDQSQHHVVCQHSHPLQVFVVCVGWYNRYNAIVNGWKEEIIVLDFHIPTHMRCAHPLLTQTCITKSMFDEHGTWFVVSLQSSHHARCLGSDCLVEGRSCVGRIA